MMRKRLAAAAFIAAIVVPGAASANPSASCSHPVNENIRHDIQYPNYARICFSTVSGGLPQGLGGLAAFKGSINYESQTESVWFDGDDSNTGFRKCSDGYVGVTTAPKNNGTPQVVWSSKDDFDPNANSGPSHRVLDPVNDYPKVLDCASGSLPLPHN